MKSSAGTGLETRARNFRASPHVSLVNELLLQKSPSLEMKSE